MRTRVTTTLSALLLVPLFAGLIRAQQPTAKPTPETQVHTSITGRVTAPGRPLSGARVVLWRQPLAEPYAGNVAAAAKTDSDGNYRLADIQPGSYFIRAETPGYINGSENEPRNLRALNIINGENFDNIDLRLWRGGVVSGKVTDAEASRSSNKRSCCSFKARDPT
jgi:hypothetical protein